MSRLRRARPPPRPRTPPSRSPPSARLAYAAAGREPAPAAIAMRRPAPSFRTSPSRGSAAPSPAACSSRRSPGAAKRPRAAATAARARPQELAWSGVAFVSPCSLQPAPSSVARPLLRPSPRSPTSGGLISTAGAEKAKADCLAQCAAHPQACPELEPSSSRPNVYAATLDKGTYLDACNPPITTAITICAAVHGGRAIGVTVHTSPGDAALGTCIGRAVRLLPFPVKPGLESRHRHLRPAIKRMRCGAVGAGAWPAR